MFYVSSRALLHGKYRFCKIFRPEFENFERNQETDFALIRNALIKATQKRLIADVLLVFYCQEV
jgi:hypothetical protein